MNKTAYILGTGGQCRVVLSILNSIKIYRKLLVIELDSLRIGEKIMGQDVISFNENIFSESHAIHQHFFLAIGSLTKRKKYWKLLSNKGVQMPNLISPNSIVDPSAKMGGANIICAQSYLGPCAQIGNNNLINTASILEHESSVGDHCHMAPKSFLAGRSVIGNNCFIGAGATIIDKIKVANGTVLGANSCLLENVEKENQKLVGIPAKLTNH